MSTQWDNEETFGEWILKEVYFQDGWPCVMRDPIKKWVSLTDEEVHDCFQQGHKNKAIERQLISKAIEAKLKEKNT